MDVDDLDLSQPSNGNNEQEQARRAQEEQQKRRDLMAALLDPAARERLSRIAIVSPERAAQIESIIARMVQSGQVRGRITEASLIELLEQLDEARGKSSAQKSTIIYHRRKDPDDDFDI
ncbi:hypothetical protein BDN72DRAFT_755279 [Pluteus cervinus]|uniref:Uncharacterized protein n=1 Tax=Pluteus cervinus TaxID=181527 RepID=A0ACD3BG61_9AGAR|nr:hypothetical protein BDN72DRAFT_755279 [Pluteus cervinus]